MVTTYQPGKAPILLDTAPSGLTAYTRAARLFFRAKKVEDDEEKIAYVGAGLVNFPELYNWYLSSAEEHEAKAYDTFLLELQRRALPRDYLWEAKARLRLARQGEQDYEDRADAMRTEHLSLTAKVLGTNEFVECLLFGMDAELSGVLRRGEAVKGSGLHQDDAISLFLSPASTAKTAASTIDYTEFDKEAHNEWAPIVARRHSNAAQIKSLSKKAASLTVGGNSSSRGSSRAPSAPNPPSPGTRLARRYPRLLQCRRSYVDHEAKDCAYFAPAGFVVPVPPGWDASKPVPNTAAASSSTSVASSTTTVGIRAVHSVEDGDIDIPESFADGSDTDTDGCAFPPLSLRFSPSRRSRSVLALADSGSSVTLISDKLAKELELERFKLSRPKRCRVALKGGDDSFTITEFVRAPVYLENGSWSVGATTFLIAPLEDPFDAILGVPFLRQHRLTLSAFPEPRILVERGPDQEPFDLLAPVHGPATAFDSLRALEGNEKAEFLSRVAEACAVQLAEDVEALTSEERSMKERAQRLMDEFDDLFPSALPPLTADYLSRTSTRHRIKLIDPNKVHNQRGFAVPRKWRERWKRMLEEHLAAGRLRPSTSPYASAAFVVPKKDPEADPRWVNDYRSINSNTVKDRTPLPLPDLVLSDAALAKYWGKIDMTNAFFQSPMDEDDIAKTAIKTPWGLFEWTVMPQGLCNAPATHQARVNEALRHLIGVCCQAFVDDIIIYSKTREEHEANCRAVLLALREANLYCSRKKTDHFALRTDFLGHVISRQGIEADPSKTDKIKNWSRPKTVTQGLTNIEPLWGDKEEAAFLAIKQIVTSLPVLRAVDQDSDEPIWLMTDASKVGIGAVLLQGADWRTAQPCGFCSRQYIPAEKNYPTHEQELLAVVAALKAWRVDLLGVSFRVLTDHDTLKHFRTQPTLSKRQARWTETLADYNYELSYIPGKLNTVADSLSRFSFSDPSPAVAVCGISEYSLTENLVQRVRGAYEDDPFCKQVQRNLGSSPGFSVENGLILFEGNRIVIPKDKTIKEALLHDAHDALGHLGAKKTLSALSLSFFWPRMATEVIEYVSSCDGCQRHKSRTTRTEGKLHSLPVPPRPFSDVALDFVGPLPLSEGRDMLLTITDRLTGYTRLIPCRSKDGAKEMAEIVFRGWFALFGLPERMVSDRDKLFTSKFWRSLHSRLGLKLQMSTSFHPETDGRSERTNKTAIQVLRQYVSRHQKDWVRFLPLTEYALNAAMNESTGATPFSLVLGYTPSLFPSPSAVSPSPLPAVEDMVKEREARITEVRDSLAVAKVRQADSANAKRKEDSSFQVGDMVMVDSTDRRARYKTRSGDGRAAKLFPRWDGPYAVEAAFAATSTFRLSLPPNDKSHPVFHISKLKRYTANDPSSFPSREPPRPDPIDVDGEQEWTVEAIVDEKGRGRALHYLVKWAGYPDSDNSWEPPANVKDTAALGEWKKRRD
ncbi:hypothetical protein JCM10213_008100 [Rhodosporidiobolus nylandii]